MTVRALLLDMGEELTTTRYCHAAQAQLASTDTRKPEARADYLEISKHPLAGA
jgi:hypothetical protein